MSTTLMPQPRFDTINRVCHALGVQLVAKAIHA